MKVHMIEVHCLYISQSVTGHNPYIYLLPSHIAQQCIISYSVLGNIFPYCPVVNFSQLNFRAHCALRVHAYCEQRVNGKMAEF